MIYRKLGTSDWDVSVITLGSIGMGIDGADDNESIAAVHAAVEEGINLIDLAPSYGAGHAEEVFGKAMKEIPRDKFYVATKCGEGVDDDGNWWKSCKPEKIRKQLEKSLKRTGLDYFDLYQIHWPDENTPFEETFGELQKMKQEGKIREIGVSNFSSEQLEEAGKYEKIVSLQAPYSLLDRRIENNQLPYCAEKKIGVISYGSIGGGALTGKFKECPVFDRSDIRCSGFYPWFKAENWENTIKKIELLQSIVKERGVSLVEAAINWCLVQPGMISAIVGARDEKQVKANVKATEWSLTADECERIKKGLAVVDAE